MRTFKTLFLLFSFTLVSASLYAQNRYYDWSIGVHPSISSYSAVLERKISNPYEYSIGIHASFSRYLNRNFDLNLEGSRTNINFPINPNFLGEEVKYEKGLLYDAAFSLKYKLDNGYILPEHFVFAPFLKAGVGGNTVNIADQGFDYFIPLGVGVEVDLGRSTSMQFQSTFKYDFDGDFSYMNHSLGLIVHFGKAGRKRVAATNARAKQKRYTRIRKYREKQRIVKARLAEERLAKIKMNPPKKETFQSVDNDLILTLNMDEPPTMDRPIPTVAKPTPKEEVVQPPKSSLIDTLPLDAAIVTKTETPVTTSSESPAIPEPPATSPSVVESERIFVEIGDPKPPLPKPVPSKSTPLELPSSTALADLTEQVEILEYQPPINVDVLEEDKQFCATSDAYLSEIGEDIIFDSDRYRIRSGMQKPLKEVIEVMDRCRGMSYVIIAHTDSDGDESYNQTLSNRRAVAIKKYLIDRGVSPERLITVAYGASLPVAPNNTDYNKARNRRIEFKINYKKAD